MTLRWLSLPLLPHPDSLDPIILTIRVYHRNFYQHVQTVASLDFRQKHHHANLQRTLPLRPNRMDRQT